MFCWLSVWTGSRTTVKNLVKSLQAHVLRVLELLCIVELLLPWPVLCDV